MRFMAPSEAAAARWASALLSAVAAAHELRAATGVDAEPRAPAVTTRRRAPSSGRAPRAQKGGRRGGRRDVPPGRDKGVGSRARPGRRRGRRLRSPRRGRGGRGGRGRRRSPWVRSPVEARETPRRNPILSSAMGRMLGRAVTVQTLGGLRRARRCRRPPAPRSAKFPSTLRALRTARSASTQSPPTSASSSVSALSSRRRAGPRDGPASPRPRGGARALRALRAGTLAADGGRGPGTAARVGTGATALGGGDGVRGASGRGTRVAGRRRAASGGARGPESAARLA